MSSDLAIKVEGLGKTYTIHHDREEHTSLAEHLMHRLRHLRGVKKAEKFQALRDLSFEVQRGEVLGIIGRNGAGKSTLLKLLSRITRPTTGWAELNGRVGSLLEVGTGFHRELTGRENIYLNGSILGMRRAEITRRFDEIVAFSGVEKFLDTPVKRYSSGMYVRLAFSVAAHLRTDILIIDEVLAVGDVAFQNRCLGKMNDVARDGRTVLFVSHNMSAVLNLCTRGILLVNGQVRMDGQVEDVVDRYLDVDREACVFEPDSGVRSGDGRAAIVGFSVEPQPPQTGGGARFIFDVERPPEETAPLPAEAAVGVLSNQGGKLFHLFSQHARQPFELGPGRTRLAAEVDTLPLAPGRYRLNLWLGSSHVAYDFLEDCVTLLVEPGPVDSGIYAEARGYPVIQSARWTCSAERASELAPG